MRESRLPDKPALLAHEMEEDIAHGLVGKTAIHPSQVALIEQHYRVHRSDVEAALRIMDSASPAVFKMHDSMCEVATHRAPQLGSRLRGNDGNHRHLSSYHGSDVLSFFRILHGRYQLSF